MKWRNANQLSWQGRTLSVFQHTNGTYTGYVYNADGIRTQKLSISEDSVVIELTAEYTLDGNKIVAEQRGDTMLYYLYDDTGAIMGISYGYDTYTFAKNPQGDVIGIYSGGTLVAKNEYNAYGQILSITNSAGNDISGNASHIANLNPFRYRGYYYDTETGFYYLQSRYYDPVVGRFLNADAFVSTGQGILGNNMFAYCLNNPVNMMDYMGMCSTAAEIKRCLSGGNCCDEKHSSSDYLFACFIERLFDSTNTQKVYYRDVSVEICIPLNKAATMARNLSEYVNEMDIYSRGGGMIGIYATFYCMVNHGAIWDIKLKEVWEQTIGTPFPGKGVPVMFCGTIMTPESLGNFTYGYLGAAFGIPYEAICAGSYYAANFPTKGEKLGNEVKDQQYVFAGYYLGLGMVG